MAMTSPTPRPIKLERIVWACPHNSIWLPRGSVFSAAATSGLISLSTPPRSRPLTPPNTSITVNSARVVTYPAGQAVEFSAVTNGHATEVVLVPSGGQLWEVDVFTAGSARAKRDYPGMLQSLRLPTAVMS